MTKIDKFNINPLINELITLPITKENFMSILTKINVDKDEFKSFILTDFETGIERLNDFLFDNGNIDEINYLAALLTDFDENDMDKIEAILEYSNKIRNIKDLINLLESFENYTYLPYILSEADLGHYYVYSVYEMDVPDHIAKYLDYYRYGQDIRYVNAGTFLTGGGYIENVLIEFPELYKGRNDIPDEYRLSDVPDQLEKIPTIQRFDLYESMVSENSNPQKRQRSEEISRM